MPGQVSDDQSGETTVTEPIAIAAPPSDDDGVDSGSAPEQGQADESDADQSDAVEGPRRRERRERAERREAQARAVAIEQARREAKRRARGRAAEASKPVARGAVRGLKLFLLSLLLIVAATTAGLILYFTPAMSARNIIVTGIGAVTREEVLDAAHVRLGTPLLQISTDRIADQVAAIRRVASARVQRQYPSALRITVVERVPVVVKDFPDGPHLFDRDCVDFATAPPPPATPYIDVDNPGPDDLTSKAALAVLLALRPEVAAQVGRIAAPSVASITLTLADGDLGDQRAHRGKSREAGGPADPARPDLRRIQPRPAHRQIGVVRGNVSGTRKFGRNSPAAFRRACIDHARDGHTVLLARVNLT
jgi:cell division protein FtsQ